ncbi:MAG TPA: NUDIX hydrolase [Chitinophagaceae bacterium]|nr:NUDIX hydrolase [Chitinophagaceae bacterium]
MHIKIYFSNKPLYLCDDIDQEIAPYVHHDDAVFIDEFSTPAINSMIHEMRLEKIHAGILYHTNLEALKKAVFKKFTTIQAAGGLVLNPSRDMLFIFRRGRWDLPKGKLDPGESLDYCALREVKEETGLQHVRLIEPLLVTYHTYDEDGKHLLKETHWYLMHAAADQSLKPQHSEDIEDIKWVSANELGNYLDNTFPLIKDVVKEQGLLQP